MAQKTSRLVVCDFPHDREVFEGTNSMSFVLEGRTYEIDLCGAHTQEFTEKMSRYTHHARRVRASRRPPKFSPEHSREQSADIRQWARTLGLDIKERGRLRQSVIAAYDAVH